MDLKIDDVELLTLEEEPESRYQHIRALEIGLLIAGLNSGIALLTGMI